MSSDLFVEKMDLLKLGCHIRENLCDITGEPIKSLGFPDYPYYREITIDNDDGKEIVYINCGGAFRVWIQSWLKNNNVPFEIYH